MAEKREKLATAKPRDEDELLRCCGLCGVAKPRFEYSKRQWKIGAGGKSRKCAACCGNDNSSHRKEGHSSESQPSEAQHTGTGTGRTKGGRKLQRQQLCTAQLRERPLMEVPGFDGLLLCCTDWPQTKRGAPPSAQSAIFVPLIACVIGPIENYCTAAQLDFATRWWTAALPSWPKWIDQLREAGALDWRERLLKRAKGQKNSLIHKAKGCGHAPHFNGKVQVQVLELAPMVAIEVYACVTCMYSQSAVRAQCSSSQRASNSGSRAAGATTGKPDPDSESPPSAHSARPKLETESLQINE